MLNFKCCRYSWCSERVLRDGIGEDSVGLKDMIPMNSSNLQELTHGAWKPKLIIGHNVGFDRSFIQEQYYIKVGQYRSKSQNIKIKMLL